MYIGSLLIASQFSWKTNITFVFVNPIKFREIVAVEENALNILQYR